MSSHPIAAVKLFGNTAPRRKRWTIIGAAILSLALLLVILLQTDSGRVWLLRSYLRVQAGWSKVLPFNGAKALSENSTPLMTRIGVYRPVWFQVEPGVKMLLNPSEHVGRSILMSFRTTWDPQIWDALSGSLCEGCVFLDVGAHIGYFTLKGSVHVGPSGRVVAFEPAPSTVAQLQANVAASGAKNVTVVPVACTDTETSLTFYDASDGDGSVVSSISHTNAGQKSREITVPGRPIDNVVRELGLTRVDVLKVDVEGAELYVLRGARETLQRFHPKLILEVIPDHLAGMNTTVDQLVAFVKEMGYTRGRQVGDHDWEWQ